MIGQILKLPRIFFFLDDRHRYIPELVVDYILLTIMVNNRNIYAVISQITQDILREGYCAVKDRVKRMTSIDDPEPQGG